MKHENLQCLYNHSRNRMRDCDFLLTYNPEYLEVHSNSSDFEDSKSLRGKVRNHSVCLRKKLFKHSQMANYEKEMRSIRHKSCYGKTDCVYDNHGLHPRHCTCNDCLIPVGDKANHTKNKRREVEYNNGNENRYVQRTPSMLTAVRSRIVPCLSNIFRRPYHSNRDDSLKKKHIVVNSTRDNYCQVYSVNCNHRTFKNPIKKQNDATHSMYCKYDASDNSPDTDITINKVTQKDTQTRDSCTSCEISSSSVTASIQTAKKKFTKIIEREIKKAYYKKHLAKQTHEQQCPSKQNFHVFMTPKTSKFKQMQNDFLDMNSALMPSGSSVFWEYLVERINKKYQNDNRGGLIRSCHCTTPGCPKKAAQEALLRDDTGLKLDYKTYEKATQGSVECSCKTTPMSPESPAGSGFHTPIKTFNPKQATGKKFPTKRNVGTNPKVHCKCRSIMPLPDGKSDDSPKFLDTAETKRPCQEPHDQIKDTLEKKYNGEILCIHNPPCILINGCLNLPPVKGQFSPETWPVTQNASFHCGYQKSDGAKLDQEQGCQYQPADFKQYHVVEYIKTDKTTQSICNHDPPCEIVRRCYKPEFQAKPKDSCIHVPLCEKVPEAIMDKNDSCKSEHEQRCAELTICNKEPINKYIVLTETGDVGTQVKPISNVECRHVPPCIMIPKCLGKLMCEGYVAYDAIPDCIHQPTCEMIPACCRKSAKMVSVSCQNPNSCRIV